MGVGKQLLRVMKKGKIWGRIWWCMLAVCTGIKVSCNDRKLHYIQKRDKGRKNGIDYKTLIATAHVFGTNTDSQFWFIMKSTVSNTQLLLQES